MIEIACWRIGAAQGDPPGLLLWFDPLRERPELRELTGEEESALLDSSVSVSGLDEDEAVVALAPIDPSSDQFSLFESR